MRFQLLVGALVQAVALFLAAGGVSPAAAVDPPRPAVPVCAFLDPERAPRVALLEAKLLADPSATWVERATIEKVLQEQTLQAVFGPQGGADRVRLGKLLKADLLVLVRPLKEAKEPVLEVVVSDTARGLRLAVRAIAVTKDADADVAALRDAVRAGLKKFQEEVREVAAVPAFASTNLGYDYEHLKGAYAKLVEQAALASPGVVVVELAEAEAIAREIKLADPGATVKRSPPLYLLGEFRHQGRGADVRVALKLKVIRGGQIVGDPVEQTVAPAEAPAILRRWAAERLASGKTGPVPALDPKVEAQQLAELSRSRQGVGDWADALALLEASLLLDPTQPELNADAMVLLKIRIEQLLLSLGRSKQDIDLYRRAAQLHRRGFEHLEGLVTSGAKLPRFAKGTETIGGERMFYSSFHSIYKNISFYTAFMLPTDSPAIQELVQELVQESRAQCLRLLPIIVKDGIRGDIRAFFRMGLAGLSVEEKYGEKGRLILKYQDSLSMTDAVGSLVWDWEDQATPEGFLAYSKFLDRLEKEGNVAVRAGVGRARQYTLPTIEKSMRERAALAENRAMMKQRLAKPNEAAMKNPRPLTPQPVPLTKEQRETLFDERLKSGSMRKIPLKAESPNDETLLNTLRGVVAAGRGIDVFWARGYFPPPQSKNSVVRFRPGTEPGGKSGPVLLVMKEKGQLRRVWEKPGAPTNFSVVCFDGRYVWAATTESLMAPALFILDPVSEKVYEVTAADGLPQPPENLVGKPPSFMLIPPLRLAPLEPGRVCVAGGFGRGWVGVAKFDHSTQKVTVKVIHEARELPRPGEKEEDLWPNPNLIFSPIYAHTLRGRPDGAGKTPCRVLIGRRMVNTGINTYTNANMTQFAWHPLIINPDGPSVAVLRESLFPKALHDSAVTADGTGLVVEENHLREGKVRLLRVEYPGTVRELGPLAIPSSIFSELVVGVSKDRLHFARYTWVQGMKYGSGSMYWLADLDGKNLRKVTDDLPKVLSFANSSHYGLLAWCGDYPLRALCQVEVSDAAGK